MAESKPPDLPTRDPWFPPYYDETDAAAVRAVAEGRASEFQQQRALAWIIFNCCGTYDQPWRPGGMEGQRATDFACGRSFVGQNIIKLIKINMSANRG